MKINVKNLTKLADGLPNVSEKQFDMRMFQVVFDGDLFQKKHPVLARRELEQYGPVAAYHYEDLENDDDLLALSPTFKILHNCGTSGCALGWAPALVARGKKGEGWPEYCVRVFGVPESCEEWDYMFSGNWRGIENTPKATAKRIMFIVENGRPPKDWSRQISFGDWE